MDSDFLLLTLDLQTPHSDQPVLIFIILGAPLSSIFFRVRIAAWRFAVA